MRTTSNIRGVHGLLSAVDAAVVAAGAFFVLIGVTATVVTLKWRGYRRGGFFVPNVRPLLAIALGAVFWLLGLWLIQLSTTG